MDIKKLITNRFLFALFLLQKLPMGFIAGLKVIELNEQGAKTTVKYKWLNQNPFGSVYFAVLSMAAELSTGIILMNGVFNSKPAISMLVVKNSATYTKKAVGKITFTCADGKLISDSIKKAKETGEGVIIEAKTVGKDEKGDTVAEFLFVWSIKVKSK